MTAEPTFAQLNNLEPLVPQGAEIEPVALVDKSGSNDWPSVRGGNGHRWDLVTTPIMKGVVVKLAPADSQASHEEDGGGLMTVTFADEDGGENPAVVVGDLNPRNFEQEWRKIRYGGRTFGVSGMKLLERNYMKEFGGRPITARPLLGILAIGDGIMNDLRAFVDLLENGELSETVRMAFAIHGFDNEDAIAAFKEVEQRLPYSFRLLQVTPSTPADVVGDAMLKLLGLAG